jgi:hypothetical protein
MSDKVSDEFLRHTADRYRAAARDPGPFGREDDSLKMAASIDELLQRRKDGQSPEEFVVLMAARLNEVAPEAQGNFLAHLSTIRESLMRIRTIETVSMKPGGWS